MLNGLRMQGRKPSGRQLNRKDLSFTSTCSYIPVRLLVDLNAHLAKGTPQLVDVQTKYDEFLRLLRVSNSHSHAALPHMILSSGFYGRRPARELRPVDEAYWQNWAFIPRSSSVHRHSLS